MAQWEQPPKLRDDLVSSEQEIDGKKFVVLKDPITYRYFRLREPEFFLVRQFDGKTDFDTAARRFREKFDLNVSAEAVGKFADKIDSLYFFQGTKAEYEISSGRYLGRTKKSLFSRLLFVKLKAFNPDRLLSYMLPFTRFLFHPVSVALMILMILAGFAVYSANFDQFAVSPRELFSIGSLVIIILSMAIIITLHEFAHALSCKYFGGQVREMGFLLLYFQLCFYSNLSDSWMFRRKSHRLAVIWAGLFFQMVLFALAVFGWRVTVIGTDVNSFFWLTSNVCFWILLFNLNPLIKLDAYYILSEWVNIPNLRAKSFDHFKRLIKKVVGLRVEPPISSRRERRAYVWYMLLAGVYSTFLIVYTAWLVYGFLVDNLGGFGFVLFLILLAVIFKSPIVKGITFLASREVMKAFVSKPRNLIISVILLAAVVVVFFVISFPRQVGGDVVVRPAADYSLTMVPGQGLLELAYREGGAERRFSTEHLQISSGDLSVLRLTPLVNEGDLVAEADTLAAIVSNQVSANLDAARAELESLEGELALAQSPPKPEEIATAQATVNAHRTTVEQLEIDIARNLSLFEKNLISRQELEQSQSALKIAEANLEEAEAELRLLKSPPKQEEVAIIQSRITSQKASIQYMMSQASAQVITSPLNGRVIALNRGNLLCKVADMSQVEIAIPVIDNYLEFVQAGAGVRLKVRTFPGRQFDGSVIHIANSAEAGGHSDNRARFPVYSMIDNADNQLRDGMSGYAKIDCGRASLAKIIAERVKAYIRVEFWSWW